MQKKLRNRCSLRTLFFRLRRPFVVVAVLLTLAFSGSSGPPTRVASTANCPPEMLLYYFYSDETHTTEVGQRHYWCDGRITGWGLMTLYEWSEVYMPCCNCGPCN